MDNRRAVYICVLVMLLTAFIIMPGCVKKQEHIENDIPQAEDSQEEDAVEIDKDQETLPEENEEGISSSEDDKETEHISEDSSEDQEDAQQEPPASVELSAKHVGGYEGSITMLFDLVNGIVTGDLELEYAEVFLEGTNTAICVYFIKGEITGTVDLETRIISAEFIGEASSEDRGCYSGELKFNLTGKISKDYSVARGTTDYGGVDWSVFN